MNRSLLLGGLAGFLAVGGIAVAVGTSWHAPDTAAGELAPRDPTDLLLLSSLPLLFGTGFDLDAQRAPLVDALEDGHEIEAIAVADAASLEGHDLLLMAHPLAQPADALVDLDEWVRAGGHVLLLADPGLAWDTGLPLGHPQAPPPFFADTGLLGHWGLTLDGPLDAGEAGAATALGATAPGRLSSDSPGCTLHDDGFVARCRVGEGAVTVIADADLAASDPGIALILNELASLAR
ncbi:hypothetical protein [Sphingomicrobium nitratireducens]|uniref:hypothetical protein n=1 Tax=Sphingomicrobium nitratireducens TaxID=2964666 RepID=UPI002240CDC5|nr:hypothetical protein [Sphingomicrobium nitratireducens]